MGQGIVKQDLQRLVYYDSQVCATTSGSVGEAIAVGIKGEVNLSLSFGFSMIATSKNGAITVRDAAGFMSADGKTSATFQVSGSGILDVSKNLGGDTISKIVSLNSLNGHSLFKGWISFETTMEQEVQLTTSGGSNGAISFDGSMETSAEAAWGTAKINFPDTPSISTSVTTVLSRGTNNKLRPLTFDTPSSEIAVTNNIKLSLGIRFLPQSSVVRDGPVLSLSQSLSGVFNFGGSSSSICLDNIVGLQNHAKLTSPSAMNWGDNYERPYIQKLEKVGTEQCYSSGSSKAKRQNNTPGAPNSDPPGAIILLGSDYANRPPVLNCVGAGGCFTCELRLDRSTCCGCAWIPPSELDSGALLGEILINGGLFTSPFLKRSLQMANGPGLEELGMSPVPHHSLYKRATAIGSGRKPLAICGYELKSEQYPQYPDYEANPDTDADWDGDSKTTLIKQYFHNSSATCTSFDVGQFSTHDNIYTWPKRGIRAMAYHQYYNTEHAFEAQTITRFFTMWIKTKSAINFDCTWIDNWINLQDTRLGTNADGYVNSVATLLVDELGSTNKPERLAVFLKNSNGHKGRLFRGATAIGLTTFARFDAGDQQLVAARQVGMIFPYMNHNVVWRAFCDSYNGMLSQLEAFDTYYLSRNPGSPSNLAMEWPKYIRGELDRVVIDARTNIRLLDANKKLFGAGAIFATVNWPLMMTLELPKVKLDRTDLCRNLPPTAV
jgi:chitinase